MGYCVAGKAFKTKDELRNHIRGVRNSTPLYGVIEDPVVLWFLTRHPQWGEKSQGMTSVGTAMVKGSPAAALSKEIVILRGEAEPMDISWAKLVNRLQKNGTLKHPSDYEEALAELRIAARQEVEVQLVSKRQVGMHLDHAYPATFEQLLLDWFTSLGMSLLDLKVDSSDGLIVVRTINDRDLAESWRNYHLANAVLVLRTPAEHAAQPQLRVDWSAHLS